MPNGITTADKRAIMHAAVRACILPDTYLGEPHPDTVDAITDGVLARIAVSQARPRAYANEPWRGKDPGEHMHHACGHSGTAYLAARFDSPAKWVSDLGQPEAAHAGLRIDFALWTYAKGTL